MPVSRPRISTAASNLSNIERRGQPSSLGGCLSGLAHVPPYSSLQVAGFSMSTDGMRVLRRSLLHRPNRLRDSPHRPGVGRLAHVRDFCNPDRDADRKSIGCSVLPCMARSASTSPMTLANLKPCPENPHA